MVPWFRPHVLECNRCDPRNHGNAWTAGAARWNHSGNKRNQDCAAIRDSATVTRGRER